jgi:copper resistance protein C
MKSIRLFFVALLFLAGSWRATAHAFLDHASPRVGCCCAAPDQVELWMTRELDAGSKMRVFDAQGTEVDAQDVKISGINMTVSLPRLKAGTYLVKWKAIAKDQHETSGSFNFTVQ